jgi:hypothetical protein
MDRRQRASERESLREAKEENEDVDTAGIRRVW